MAESPLLVILIIAGGLIAFTALLLILVGATPWAARSHRKMLEERERKEEARPMGPNETVAYHSHFVRLGKEVEGLDPNARCGWIARNQTFLIAGLEAHYMMADGRLSKKHAIEKARNKLKIPWRGDE